MKALWEIINWFGFLALSGLVWAYRLMIKPLLPPGSCRFQPTCSQYLLDSVRRRGVLIGTWKGIVRLSRCRPGHPGGYDPA